MASQSKTACVPKGQSSARSWGVVCGGAGATALMLQASARTTGFAAPARTILQAMPTTTRTPLGLSAQESARSASVLNSPMAAASGMALAAGLAAGAVPRKSRRGRVAKNATQLAACPCEGVHGKKTQCLHPDKPVMFACADCPRRTGMIGQADVEVATAAYFGEADDAMAAKKTQCIHPDKPMMFACGDCPRRNGKVATMESSANATAAYLGESDGATLSAKKTQCIHPDKPMMFACGDCPRRGAGKACLAAMAESEGADVATAAFLGEIACNGGNVTSKKTQCLHPDKPMMFACADCPRRGAKACMVAEADLDGAEVATAAYLGESLCSDAAVTSKKTQCLHPDKPMMFACADCPRRGGKAPLLAEEEPGAAEVAAAGYLGECPGAPGKKTQCLHPDKPMMFACSDCPRRGGKAPATEPQGELAAAAFVSEEGCALSAKKTQCIHPDKPMMFACADCPRRGGKAPVADLDGEEVSAAAYAGECACAGAALPAKKTQCIHPDKPMMFACGDCPRRGSAVAALAGEEDEMAVAAFVSESAATDRVAAKKDKCLHPDKPVMFACADCPRRG